MIMHILLILLQRKQRLSKFMLFIIKPQFIYKFEHRTISISNIHIYLVDWVESTFEKEKSSARVLNENIKSFTEEMMAHIETDEE